MAAFPFKTSKLSKVPVMVTRFMTLYGILLFCSLLTKKVKSGRKSQLDSSSDVETLILTSPEDCRGWIEHPGILNIQVYTTSIDFVNTLIFHSLP